MAGKRTREVHLQPHLYVKRGKRKDTYYTIIGGKYHGLGNDRHEAQRALTDLVAGAPVSGSIADMCERFIAYQRELRAIGDANALAERTIDDYEAGFLAHINPVFGSMKPSEFKPAHAAQYLSKMRAKKRGTRANQEIAGLSSAFYFGMSIGVVDRNPCLGIKYNPSRPRTRKPEIAEANALFAVAQEMGKGYFMVALIAACVAITGRRRAEIRELMDFAMKDDGLHVPESKIKPGEEPRVFVVEWTPFLRELIGKARELREADSQYLFPARSGGPYTDPGFKAMWNRIQVKFSAQGGKRFTAHDLRALYTSEMLDRNIDPNTHKNPATTRRVYDRRNKIKVTPMA